MIYHYLGYYLLLGILSFTATMVLLFSFPFFLEDMTKYLEERIDHKDNQKEDFIDRNALFFFILFWPLGLGVLFIVAYLTLDARS